MGLLRKADIHGVQYGRKIGVKDRMLMLGFNETTDQLAMADSVRCCGYIFWRALNFMLEGQRMKGRLKRTWRKQLEKESKVG